MVIDAIVVIGRETIGFTKLDFATDVVHPLPPLEMPVAVKGNHDPKGSKLPGFGK